MKTSVLILESALVAGLCFGPGCASRRAVQVQDPGYSAPVDQPVVATIPSPAVPSPGPTPSPELTPTAKPETAKPSEPEPARPTGPLVVNEAPPPPQIEVVGTSPGKDYVWIPGYWQWKNHWTWMDGHWAIGPRPNAAWIPGRWVRRTNGGWLWVKGYWR